MDTNQQTYLQIDGVDSGDWCPRLSVDDFISDLYGISPVDLNGHHRTFKGCYSDTKDGYLWYAQMHSTTGRRFIVCSSATLKICHDNLCANTTKLLVYYDRSHMSYPFPYLYIIDEFGNDQPVVRSGPCLRSVAYVDDCPEFVLHIYRLLPNSE
jgi:hypothetical protein